MRCPAQSHPLPPLRTMAGPLNFHDSRGNNGGNQVGATEPGRAMMTDDHQRPDGRYQSALEFLYGRINYEQTTARRLRPRDFNVNRMAALLAQLGDPHRQFRTVHIAGTKGKGSTANMISAVLTAAGYRTGLYTSPHLQRLEERMVVDGQAVDETGLVELVEEIRPAVERFERSLAQQDDPTDGLTFFELTTALAFLHFARRAVDLAVVEVGLGGRLDSTNVCVPSVSVITSISFDHMKQLGNTLEKIAFEKAGIIKPNVPVISGVSSGPPADVIGRVAESQKAPLFQLGTDFDFDYVEADDSSPWAGWFQYRDTLNGSEFTLERVPLRMFGRHQAANGAVAVAAVRCLQHREGRGVERVIPDAIASVRCPARIELVCQRPAILIDAAHNVASIEALADVLQRRFRNRPRLLLFGTSRDKDPAGMLRHLLPLVDDVLLTSYQTNPRAMAVEQLSQVIGDLLPSLENQSRQLRILSAPTPAAAWQMCQELVSPDHVICVTGSFFLAAEMRPLICEQLPTPA